MDDIPEFMKVVEYAWKTPSKWEGMQKVWLKLKAVKKELNNLHTQEFKRVGEKIQSIRRKLKET